MKTAGPADAVDLTTPSASPAQRRGQEKGYIQRGTLLSSIRCTVVAKKTCRYVEALERQQSQLVAGLRGLYRCLQNRQGWPGQPLEEVEGGHPLTHDILERLDLLHPSSSTSSICEDSVENLKRMQQKLLGIEMSLVRSRDLDLGGSHAESCPPLDEATTVESFPIKAHLFPTQCQDVWLADRELPADWLTQANDVAPEASQISWKMLLNDMTMTDQQAGSSHPLNELADFEEFSQPAICDRVYSDNNPTPDWNDIHHLDLSNLLQTPFSA